MGRFMRNFRKKIEERIEDAVNEATGNSSSGSKSGSGSGSSNSAGKMNQINAQNEFENNKPDSMRKDVRMISGCDDTQTSADVSNVNSFCLPDPAGQAGGACTSTLLNILYKDETVPEDTMSFTEVLEKMRTNLKENGYSQIPQLTSLNPIDITTDFTLVPTTTGGGGGGGSGVLRAVMIGINYVGHEQGELSGCHNDVLNMVSCILLLSCLFCMISFILSFFIFSFYSYHLFRFRFHFLPTTLFRSALIFIFIFIFIPLLFPRTHSQKKKYIMNVHGFEEDNIVVLMDDDQHISPTKSNIINAYKQIINDSNDGDTIFLHYSGK
jgi:hypothetical protein